MPVTGGATIPKSVDDVSKSYINMVDTQLKETVDFIMNANSNVLYFCNAGKDRTGIVSAILLWKAGMVYLCFSTDFLIEEADDWREYVKWCVECVRRYFEGKHTTTPIWEIISDKPAKAVKDITFILDIA